MKITNRKKIILFLLMILCAFSIFGKEISGKTIRITAKAGQNGKLFGSVTSKEIAEKLKSEFGISVDKRKVVVDDIKQFGTYEFEVKLYQGISAKLFVMVGE